MVFNYLGKRNRNIQKAMEYLNGDWKEEAFSDEREVPYKAIMCIMIMGS
jgi:hypothetical protein